MSFIVYGTPMVAVERRQSRALDHIDPDTVRVAAELYAEENGLVARCAHNILLYHENGSLVVRETVRMGIIAILRELGLSQVEAAYIFTIEEHGARALAAVNMS